MSTVAPVLLPLLYSCSVHCLFSFTASGASPIPGSTFWAQEWLSVPASSGACPQRTCSQPVPCWGCSVVPTMALWFSTSLFEVCSSYTGNWECYVFTPCTAQLMPLFVTFLSVVYTAVTERINRLYFFNVASTKLGCVMYKSANRMLDRSLSFCGACSD